MYLKKSNHKNLFYISSSKVFDSKTFLINSKIKHNLTFLYILKKKLLKLKETFSNEINEAKNSKLQNRIISSFIHTRPN